MQRSFTRVSISKPKQLYIEGPTKQKKAYILPVSRLVHVPPVRSVGCRLASLSILLGLFLFTGLGNRNALRAETKDLPPARIKIQVGVASNYVSKGADKFTNRARQKKESFGPNTGAPALITKITLMPPPKGLFFKIETFQALEGREDTDVDGFIQQGPGGDNLLYGKYTPEEQIRAIRDASGFFDSTTGSLNSLSSILNGPLAYPGCASTTSCVPGFYKEQNGLFRQEEMKLYLGYGKKTRVGSFRFAVKYVAPLDKRAQKDASERVLFEYRLPQIKQLSFYMENYLSESKNYLMLRWSDRSPLPQLWGQDLKLEYKAGVAYGVWSRLQGVQFVQGRLGLESNGFRLGANIVWRPVLAFFDTDSAGNATDRIPIWLTGLSSRSDGKVADPALIYGAYNDGINRAYQDVLRQGNPLYTYTPRQSLPRYLYWVDFSYTFTVQ